MRTIRFAALLTVALATCVSAQDRGAPPPAGQPPAQPGGRGGGGRGRGAIATMTLTSTGWIDGGQIPAKYTQANGPAGEISPPLAWNGAPENTAEFVLIVHDVDAPIAGGTDDVLHWMLWKIPPSTTALPEHVAAGPERPDKTRQISATGPYYRGPGALSSGPAHHYVFELFALDQAIDVPAVGQSPPQTRAAVVAAMAGHVRGKGVLVGLFRR
ncbi:MAG TPA: YbhB/YbcL family Raf kinase inhibitor-like protein [Vicinamibacterales bacterium]|nr:YbhB/YbcL family Raf kinase inhibitor-like protein [Vicinamibacterales bacterium]